tara:strand:- start:459 stop:764 length:306 start_codon:yes stop_codon:yes gene_type:complete
VILLDSDVRFGVRYAFFRGHFMTTLSATEARANLYRVIDETAESHEPVLITSKRNNAVLLSESDWNSIQETLYLLSVSEMRESIKAGMQEDVANCSEELDW